jgi:uncharacterized membrane protein SpoIIM required for sporulation
MVIGFIFGMEIFSDGFNMDQETEQASYGEVLIELLKNNLLIVIYNLLGFATLGIVCVFNLIINGLNFGCLLFSVTKYQISAKNLIIHILPYGGMEVIGLLLSASAGIMGTLFVYKFLIHHVFDREIFRKYIFCSVLSILLTVLAGILEARIVTSMSI